MKQFLNYLARFRGAPQRLVAGVMSFVMVSTVLSLSACGGGNGGIVELTQRGAVLTTNANSVVTLGIKEVATFTVSGGGGGAQTTTYSATTSDSRVATVVMREASVIITGVGLGSAIITIADLAGGKAVINVNIEAAKTDPLLLLAPGSVSLVIGQTGQYEIKGGTAPYTSASSAVSIVTSQVNGTALKVSGELTGTASVVVYDAVGASKTITVTVSPVSAKVALYTTAPSSLTMVEKSTASYTLAGGFGPYTATSNNGSVLSAIVVGNTLTLTSALPGNAGVTILDTNGGNIAISVVVNKGFVVPLKVSAPSNIVLDVGATQSFNFIGGIAPYTTTSDNIKVVNASVNGTTLTITAMSNGTAKVFLFDSTGTSVQVGTTIGTGLTQTNLFIAAPPALTIAPSAAPAYIISGGVLPYTATTSNAAIASASISNGNVVTITGSTAGTALITVFDATGASVKVSTTVATGATAVPMYTTSTDIVTLAPNAVSSFTIAGGSGPYTIYGSNDKVALVSIAGNQGTIKGVASGVMQVAVKDATGSVILINVTVSP